MVLLWETMQVTGLGRGPVSGLGAVADAAGSADPGKIVADLDVPAAAATDPDDRGDPAPSLTASSTARSSRSAGSPPTGRSIPPSTSSTA